MYLVVFKDEKILPHDYLTETDRERITSIVKKVFKKHI